MSDSGPLIRRSFERNVGKKTKRPAEKPAIPQAQRIKHALQDMEDAHECLQQMHGSTDESRVAIAWDDYVDACRKLVSLDNSQLKNPLLRPLLNCPEVKGKRFLRKIHRGLEKGIKRPLTMAEVIISTRSRTDSTRAGPFRIF
jgi:hypothetical protein